MHKPRYKPGQLVVCVDSRHDGEVKAYDPASKEYAVDIRGVIWWLQEKDIKPRTNT